MTDYTIYSPSVTVSNDQTATLDGIILDPRQALAYQEWQRLQTSDTAPRQRDFRPDRIARALPASALLHVEGHGDAIQFIQRLEGRFVVLAFGEGSGRNIEELYSDTHLDAIMPRYLEIALTGEPALTWCKAPMRDRKLFHYTRLILPFIDEQGRVNRLLVVFHFDAVALSRLSSPLLVRRDNYMDSTSVAMPPISSDFLAKQAS